MYHGGEAIKTVNPKEKANFLSLVTFFFTLGLLKKGFKRDLTEGDIYEVPRKFRSTKLGNKLEEQWEKEVKKKTPSLYRLLWTCYGRYYLLLGLAQLVMKLIMVLVHPKALGKFISYFTTNSKLTKADVTYYAILVVGLNILNCIFYHHYMFLMTELGIRIKAALCSLIYRKSLKLPTAKLSEIGVGKIITLISKDVTIIETVVIFLNDLWIGLILIMVTSGLMYSRVGIAALAGTLFMVLIIPLQVALGKITSSFRIKASRVTDYRLQKTQETISVIKNIKMYAWETFFCNQISEARKKEMRRIRLIYWIKAMSLIIGGLVINLTLYIIVMTYTHMGNHFTAEVSFYIWDCLNKLRSVVIIYMPVGISQLAEFVASLRRIRNVLLAKEQNEGVREKTSKPFIEMERVGVTINDISILHDVTLRIESGLNFVIGRLGGGKSSLLKTILEDYPTCEGKLKVKGSLSYASEEPWLFPSSIKQNILFGQKYDKARYKKVLEVCALEQDIDTFEKGDDTIVDDRGMNLSKGQQSRINLARAVYCDSDIYLIDNCLSSLDIQIQKFIFTQCIKKFLHDKIVVIISHNEQQLKQADNIILMEHGTVKSCMRPSEIPEEDIENLVRENDKVEDGDIIDHLYQEINHEESPLIKKRPWDNIYHEEKKEGRVAFKVYADYSKFGGGLLIFIPLMVVFAAAQAMASYSQKAVTIWTNIQQNISELKFNSSGNFTVELEKNNSKAMLMYTVAIVGSTALILFRAFTYFSVAGKASVGVHKAMTLSVVHATMKFFDLHYIGNILNRFSKDLATIDEYLPLNVYECLSFVFRISGMLILILTVKWTFIFSILAVFVPMLFLQRWYLPTGRSLKRLDAATRSPMVGHINASLEGLTTIRAYGTQEILKKEFDKHQDLYTSAFYMVQCSSRAFAFFLDMLCNFLVIPIVTRFILGGKDTLAGDIGLVLNQVLGFIGMLQKGVQQWAELENQMTSVERVLEYTTVEQESKTGRVLNKWPKGGKITYENINLTYGKSKEYVLKNISFAVNPREKISVVGRTGAGKSSLISVLFRLYQYEGTVKIDDVDIKTLSLHFLRSSIAIIPQDPILFTGTIRSNIDPTGVYSDDEIWKAISTTHLKSLIPSLDFHITDSGSSFSSGQKQLLCLARAVVSKCKIIILDEATANVDPDTEDRISKTIKESFANCTVLTVAHRLHTVIYSDKVMVIDKGRIVEYGRPNELLNNKQGFFYKMIAQANLLS